MLFTPQDLRQLGAILIALGLGACIGLEREVAGKPAGLRTHALVSAGSALLMCLGNTIIRLYGLNAYAGNTSADPTRVLHAIVVGIGFLGAGTIIHEQGERVEGLTTAASIFLTAGIGVAVAVDRVALAIAVTAVAVAVLIVMGKMERYLLRKRERTQQRPDP